jgi:hypothetical protein
MHPRLHHLDQFVIHLFHGDLELLLNEWVHPLIFFEVKTSVLSNDDLYFSCSITSTSITFEEMKKIYRLSNDYVRLLSLRRAFELYYGSLQTKKRLLKSVFCYHLFTILISLLLFRQKFSRKNFFCIYFHFCIFPPIYFQLSLNPPKIGIDLLNLEIIKQGKSRKYKEDTED